jgi:hypothetical protein
MQIKITRKDSFSLIEILGNNGEPASPQNPINEQEELASVEFPEANGQLAIVSGMPASALVMVALRYKNHFAAIAVANPRLGVALVVHSTNRAYPVGSSVPLG